MVRGAGPEPLGVSECSKEVRSRLVQRAMGQLGLLQQGPPQPIYLQLQLLRRADGILPLYALCLQRWDHLGVGRNGDRNSLGILHEEVG